MILETLSLILLILMATATFFIKQEAKTTMALSILVIAMIGLNLLNEIQVFYNAEEYLNTSKCTVPHVKIPTAESHTQVQHSQDILASDLQFIHNKQELSEYLESDQSDFQKSCLSIYTDAKAQNSISPLIGSELYSSDFDSLYQKVLELADFNPITKDEENLMKAFNTRQLKQEDGLFWIQGLDSSRFELLALQLFGTNQNARTRKNRVFFLNPASGLLSSQRRIDDSDYHTYLVVLSKPNEHTLDFIEKAYLSSKNNPLTVIFTQYQPHRPHSLNKLLEKVEFQNHYVEGLFSMWQSVILTQQAASTEAEHSIDTQKRELRTQLEYCEDYVELDFQFVIKNYLLISERLQSLDKNPSNSTFDAAALLGSACSAAIPVLDRLSKGVECLFSMAPTEGQFVKIDQFAQECSKSIGIFEIDPADVQMEEKGIMRATIIRDDEIRLRKEYYHSQAVDRSIFKVEPAVVPYCVQPEIKTDRQTDSQN